MRLRVYIDCLKIYIRAFRARCCLEQSVLVCPVYHVFRYCPCFLVLFSPCRKPGNRYLPTTFAAFQAGSVFSFAPDISSAKGAATDILKLLDSVPEIDAESSEGKVLSDKAVRGHVKFENVHFRYPTRPGVRVLHDLTLEIEPGTYIVLVGASGCGKSTM